MQSIQIIRKSSRVNRNFPYKIVDENNKEWAFVSNGETVILNLPDTTKTIKAKLMWCSSKKIDLSSLKQNATLILSHNNFLNYQITLLGGLLPLTYFISRHSETLKIISLFVLGLLLVLLIGSLTIWRNRWLFLEPKEIS